MRRDTGFLNVVVPLDLPGLFVYNI